MKKFIYILGFIIATLLVIISLYMLFNIEMVVSTVDRQLYDGFGNIYVNGEPSSPYTSISYVFLIVGISLIGSCYTKLKKQKGELNEK